MFIARSLKVQRKPGSLILRTLRSGHKKGFGPSWPDLRTLHDETLADSDYSLYSLKRFKLNLSPAEGNNYDKKIVISLLSDSNSIQNAESRSWMFFLSSSYSY